MTSIVARYERTGVDIPFTMMIRRAQLIDALQSGHFKQGIDRLLNGDGSYCCIGVGCFLLGTPDSILIEDLQADYLTFEKDYGVSREARVYLQGMNDGTDRGIGSLIGSGSGSRGTYKRMNFTQIARFLEILWGMTI